MTSVNESSCAVFTAPGLTSSSNSKNYAMDLFSGRPIKFEMTELEAYLTVALETKSRWPSGHDYCKIRDL